MLHVVTGGGGAGKTLLTLKEVRERQVAEARPVYYYNIKLKPLAAAFGWIERNPREWQEFQPGAIIVADEAHKYFPKRPGNQPEPAFIEAIAEHRHGGYDFYLITQHPADLDVFLRRRVASPGWHRHLKRKGAAQIVSVLEWNTINMDPENKNAASTALVSTKVYPTEVYDWYHSADMHTAKFRIPRQVWYLVGAAVAVVALAWSGWVTFKNRNVKQAAPAAVAAAPAGESSAAGDSTRRGAPRDRVMTAQEYVSHRTPRLAGLAYTAPAYDGVTAPTVAPYPAACVEGVRPGTKARVCTCWTQQGTVLPVPPDLCGQIVRHGFFVDWNQPQALERPHPAAVGGPAGSGGVVAPGAVPVSEVQPGQAGPVQVGEVVEVRAAPRAAAPSAPPAVAPAPSAQGGKGFGR